MITKECEVCGKLFSSYKKNPRFCSMECRLIDRENCRVYLSCDYCHETFYLSKSTYQNNIERNQKKYYCCKECRLKAETHNINDIKLEFAERDYELISDTYETAKTYLYYICNKHKEKGVLKITYDNFKTGCGCKYCGDDRTANAKRNPIDKVREKFAEHDMILVDGQEYHNAQMKLKYICIHHRDKGIQEMSYGNALRNHCPYCCKSKGEGLIEKYLDDNNIKYEYQKRFDDLKGNSNRLLSYDFYLPDYNTLIEYQGEQHYHPVTVFGGDKQFTLQQQYDEMKRNYANNNDYRLLEIPYTEIKNINQLLDNSINTNILRDCGAIMAT